MEIGQTAYVLEEEHVGNIAFTRHNSQLTLIEESGLKMYVGILPHLSKETGYRIEILGVAPDVARAVTLRAISLRIGDERTAKWAFAPNEKWVAGEEIRFVRRLNPDAFPPRDNPLHVHLEFDVEYSDGKHRAFSFKFVLIPQTIKVGYNRVLVFRRNSNVGRNKLRAAPA